MQIAVLAKVVPAGESVAYDPTRRTLVREGRPSSVNPFDLRAVAVALSLRRPGDSVAVVSVGPPSAVGPLRELRAVGADRAILLSDPALAGSDVLATARAIVAVLRTLEPALILSGAYTTDSETGEVPPEVASLLGVPVVTGARSIERGESEELVVTVETPTGWARVTAPRPLVVSVGEKIARPLRATPEALATLAEPAVELVDARSAGIDPLGVGVLGSPTVVVSVREVAPRREGVTFATGAMAERVHAALEALASRWAATVRDSSPPVPPGVPSEDEDQEFLVLVSDEHGALDPEALRLVGEVLRHPPLWPSALWVGVPPTAAEAARLEAAGALGLYVVEAAGEFDSGSVAAALESVVELRPRLAGVAVLSEPFGREVAGQLAARRSLGLVGDAVGLERTGEGDLRWTKPSFGGRTTAVIRSRTRPSLATVRPGIFADPPTREVAGRMRTTRVPFRGPPARVVRLDEGQEVERTSSLERREVVVSVGMGVGGPEQIATLGRTLARWDASLVGTRRVVDAGWLPRQLQVGLTGRALAPRLAVLLGVRGAINHTLGWQRAGTILAVNSDPLAPVFRECDVGIVGRIDEVVPLLEEPVARLLGR